MKNRGNFIHHQQGVMLLEALISILIFSIGILAIVALQANSIKLASDSRYRADANLLSNDLIGQMWLAHSAPNFTTAFVPGGASYAAWASSVAATIPTTGASSPTVTIAQTSALSGVSAASTVSSTVNIDIYWVVPGENANATSHHYSTVTQITN